MYVLDSFHASHNTLCSRDTPSAGSGSLNNTETAVGQSGMDGRTVSRVDEHKSEHSSVLCLVSMYSHM